MAPIAITPEASGASTPTGTSASALTQAGIKHAAAAAAAAPTGSAEAVELAPLDASLLTYTLTSAPRAVPEPDSDEVRAQKTCTDHMVTARWTAETGWDAPALQPYGPLSIMPSASVLHYATECFEGLKLYRGFDGRLRLFRASRNCERLRRSAARIALPDFEAEQLRRLIVALCARDGPKWLPRSRPGSFLYLRPTFIATDAALGVQRPREALLYIIICCFPDMTKSRAPAAPPALAGAAAPAAPASGLRLIASEEDTVRAWPGGFGSAKVGANYGPTLVAQGEARNRGFDQVLWLFGEQAFVTEAGASNFFVVWRAPGTGALQLVTAPLHERIILEGVTRASVLDLARERLDDAAAAAWGLEPVEVVEQRFTMHDLRLAHAEGRLVEAFAAGTAFFIAPISLIHYRGEDLEIPTAGEKSSVYARFIKKALGDIMYGNEQHEWGVVVEEVDA